MEQGDKVYVRRGSYFERAEVDHTYTSATGKACVSFTSGPNATREQVLTEAEYWQRQRDMMGGY